MRKKSLGNQGENLALRYLQNKGYQFITRNFRSKFGEIDLIFQDQETLVFVEVKTRYSKAFGEPEEAITSAKINYIIKTAQYFQLTHKNLSQNIRIDVVAINLDFGSNKPTSIKHFENITL